MRLFTDPDVSTACAFHTSRLQLWEIHTPRVAVTVGGIASITKIHTGLLTMLIVAVCLGGVAVAHGLAFVGGRSCVVPHQCRRSFLSLSETPFADQARKVQALHERIKEGGNAAVPSSSRAAHNARQASTFDEASTFFASAEATPPEVVPAMQSIALSVADNLGEGARVLDVATGTGALLPFYEEQRVDLRRVVGVDLSGDMLAFARKRFPVSTFVQADFLDLEQEDVGGGFDAIVFNACFANLYDQAAAIRHAASLLNEGGRVFISHPLGSEFVRQLHASDPGVVPHVLPDEAALGEMAGRTSLTVASYVTVAQWAWTANRRCILPYLPNRRHLWHRPSSVGPGRCRGYEATAARARGGEIRLAVAAAA